MATFYAWQDGGIGFFPSNLVVRISGGTALRDPESDRLTTSNYHEIRFRKGVYETMAAEEISEIRKLIAQGETITEDKEVYLAKVEPSEHRTERLGKKASQLTGELERRDQEISRKDADIGRLRALLKEKTAR